MDCGSGVVHRMADTGTRWQDITHVALTHFHNDHIGDLPTLIFAWRHGEMMPRSRELQVIGPEGTTALLHGLAAALGGWVTDPGFPLVVREIAPGETLDLAGGVTISARHVPHTPESLAYSVLNGRRRIAYTGDTGFDEGLADWASDCDLLLAECSLPESIAMPIHLTPEECGRLAGRARAARLVLTHFYPPVELVDIPAAVAAAYDGPLTLATDGWTLDLEE